MTKPDSKDEIIALPYKELKKLEKEWIKRAKNISAFYDYQKKEFVISIIEDLKKITNQTLKKY